jgi:hypothetical protein
MNIDGDIKRSLPHQSIQRGDEQHCHFVLH